MAKYMSPFTDFGFKKLFGEEASKPLLVDFLNSLLPDFRIVNLNFKDKEKLGKIEYERKAIFDLYCDNDQGEKFIIELQKAKQKFFKDRSEFYSSFPIQEQAVQGDWDFELQPVYCIGILDFEFDNEPNHSEIVKDIDEFLHLVELKNQHNKVFFDKLKFIYLELPRFNKTETELRTQLDKWLYFIKHLDKLEHIPKILDATIFEEAFKRAEYAQLSTEERWFYEQSLKICRDNSNILNYSYQKGNYLGAKV